MVSGGEAIEVNCGAHSRIRDECNADSACREVDRPTNEAQRSIAFCDHLPCQERAGDGDQHDLGGKWEHVEVDQELHEDREFQTLAKEPCEYAAILGPFDRVSNEDEASPNEPVHGLLGFCRVPDAEASRPVQQRAGVERG